MIRNRALALILAAFAAPAVAAPDGVRIEYRDLDFSRAADIAQFQARMGAAASALCAKTAADDARTLYTKGELRERCESRVRAGVQAQLPTARREALKAAASVEPAGR